MLSLNLKEIEWPRLRRLRLRIRRTALAALAMLIALAALFQAPFMAQPAELVANQLVRAADSLAQRAGLVIAEISIAENGARASRAAITRALDAQPGHSILLFDLAAARLRVERAVPGARAVSIRRLLPNRIHVEYAAPHRQLSIHSVINPNPPQGDTP